MVSLDKADRGKETLAMRYLKVIGTGLVAAWIAFLAHLAIDDFIAHEFHISAGIVTGTVIATAMHCIISEILRRNWR